MKLVPLTQGKFAKVDDKDYEEVLKHKWHAHDNGKTWYAITGQHRNGCRQTMPEVLRGPPPDGQLWDHINGDGLDNQEGNLRLVSRSVNGINRKSQKNNTSGCPGVVFVTRRGYWQAQIVVNKKQHHLGSFTKFEDAVRKRAEAERHYFGTIFPATERALEEVGPRTLFQAPPPV